MSPPHHWAARTKSTDARGLAHGYRSGLEHDNARHLEALGVPVLFETLRIPYVVPETVHSYTPDFPLPNGIIAETKGLWDAKDRAKHLLVRVQYPGLDIRLVFSSAKTKIAPGSPTTVTEWADKHGIKWAIKRIPAAWLQEPGPADRPEAVLAHGPVGFEHLAKEKRKR